MTSSNEEKKGLEIVEEDIFEEKKEDIDKEILQLYKEHKDAIDLMGGLEMFESLMVLEDEEFKTLEPQFLSVLSSYLNEKETEKELHALIVAEEYTIESLQEEFEIAQKAINEINFLSKIKKDFVKTVFLLTSNKIQELLNSSNKLIYIPCELESDVQLPTYAHKTDAGLDIYAREEITIGPGETKIIGTGIKLAIPDGYAILIQPRSGQSAKTKLRIANTPGLIDSGYRDEIGVIIENIEPPFKNIDYDFDDNGEIHIKSIEHGQAYTIVEGQRFAQMRLVQVPKADFVEVESVGDIGEDRNGGFGSSGK